MAVVVYEGLAFATVYTWQIPPESVSTVRMMVGQKRRERRSARWPAKRPCRRREGGGGLGRGREAGCGGGVCTERGRRRIKKHE